MKYYVVYKGLKTGIYKSFEEIKGFVIGYKGAKYKSFNTLAEAEEYLKNGPKTEDTKNIEPKINITKNIEPNITKNDKNILKNKIDNYLTKLNDDNNLYIYTDGSVVGNGKKDAKGGYGVFYSDINIAPISKIMTQKLITTPLSELFAIIDGLTNLGPQMHTGSQIYLYTDSEYCYKSLTKWYKQWEKNNWKTKTNTLVKNIEEIKQAYILIKKYNVNLVHINSHTGKTDLHSLGNDIADLLAKCY